MYKCASLRTVYHKSTFPISDRELAASAKNQNTGLMKRFRSEKKRLLAQGSACSTDGHNPTELLLRPESPGRRLALHLPSGKTVSRSMISCHSAEGTFHSVEARQNMR